MKDTYYIKFLISKIAKEIKRTKSGIDISQVENLVLYLNSSKNIIKNLYILLHVRKYESIALYLLFIVKKIKSHGLNLDNFHQNLLSDKKHLMQEIKNNFRLDEKHKKEEPTAKQKKITEDDYISTEPDEESPEIKIVLDEKFRIEKTESELITEEFIETEEITSLKEEESAQDKYLELIQTEKNDEDNEIAFQVPVGEEENNEGTVNTESKGNFQNEGKEIKIEEERFTEKEAVDFINKPEELKTETNTEKETEKKIKKQTEAIISNEYLHYENEMVLRNLEILDSIQVLSRFITSKKERDYDYKNRIDIILENAEFMKKYSEKMSFTIIPNIYAVICIYFQGIKNNLPILDNYNMEILKSSLTFVENLVMGKEQTPSVNILNDIESVKTKTISAIKENDRIEKQKKLEAKKKEDLQKKIIRAQQSPQLLATQKLITELETIFKSLDDITGNFQVYESLRKLSHAFPRLKEIVKLSSQIKNNKISLLAEASYVFIKFVLNYRINPKDEEIKIVLMYTIYNFKKLFLDKPAKDLDEFIKCLNNPVMIMSKISNNNNNQKQTQ